MDFNLYKIEVYRAPRQRGVCTTPVYISVVAANEPEARAFAIFEAHAKQQFYYGDERSDVVFYADTMKVFH